MRGLKPEAGQKEVAIKESHLLQMRGLKPQYYPLWGGGQGVASFTDAWIETDEELEGSVNDASHLLQMRGLKLLTDLACTSMYCRIFYRCVD